MQGEGWSRFLWADDSKETPCVKSGSPGWGESFLHHPLEGKAANSNACMPTDGKSTW